MPLSRTSLGWKHATFTAPQRHPAVVAAALALLISGCAPLPNQPEQTALGQPTSTAAASAAAASRASGGDPNSNGRWLRWGHQRAETEALAKAAPPAPKLSDKPLSLEELQAETETEFVPDRASDQRGMASWYGPGFHGRRTANGERFNQGAMTAAHPTLAFGTKVCVRSAVNGKTVVVRINDRGPYAKGRVIDLSKAAAEELGMMGLGVKRVELWALEKDENDCPGEEVEVARAKDEGKTAASQPAAKSPTATAQGLHEDALRALEHYRQNLQQIKTAQNQ